MATMLDVFAVTVIGSLVSLIGGIVLISNKTTAKLMARYAAPFAAGGLLAAVFIDLLPEGIDIAEPSLVLTSAMIGLIIFFFLERFLKWFHCHHVHISDENKVTHSQDTKPLIITGDTLHNSLDGIAIASAFLVSFPVGLITALAVSAHEIPRNIGDFGLLLSKNMSKKGVVLVQALTSLSTVPVAIIVFWLGGAGGQIPIGLLLGLSAGFMLYIATSDVIPHIHHDVPDKNIFDIRPFLLLFGVVVVTIAIILAKQFE